MIKAEEGRGGLRAVAVRRTAVFAAAGFASVAFAAAADAWSWRHVLPCLVVAAYTVLAWRHSPDAASICAAASEVWDLALLMTTCTVGIGLARVAVDVLVRGQDFDVGFVLPLIGLAFLKLGVGQAAAMFLVSRSRDLGAIHRVKSDSPGGPVDVDAQSLASVAEGFLAVARALEAVVRQVGDIGHVCDETRRSISASNSELADSCRELRSLNAVLAVLTDKLQDVTQAAANVPSTFGEVDGALRQIEQVIDGVVALLKRRIDPWEDAA